MIKAQAGMSFLISFGEKGEENFTLRYIEVVIFKHLIRWTGSQYGGISVFLRE